MTLLDASSRGVASARQAVRRYKPALLDVVTGGLSLLGATHPRRFAKDRLTAIMFHRVLPERLLAQYPVPQIAVTPGQLREILVGLEEGFECMPLIEAYRQFRQGGRKSKPPLAVTFDDGALDNYEYALPVLEVLGMRASFYIPVSAVEERVPPWHDRLGFALLRALETQAAGEQLSEQLSMLRLPDPRAGDSALQAQLGVERAKQLSESERMRLLSELEELQGGPCHPEWAGLMSWDQVRELNRRGHEVGSHSMTHPLLPGCSTQQVHEEIHVSRQRLQDETGAPVASFCYPNGSYDARCLREVQAAGYECSVTTRWGLNQSATPAHELLRCDMDVSRLCDRAGRVSKQRLLFRLSGLQPGLASR